LGTLFYHKNVKFEISRLSGQHVAPAGEKSIFGPLSKNNTGMAALRAGLPVTSQFFVYSRRATHDPHHTWCGDRRSPSQFFTS